MSRFLVPVEVPPKSHYMRERLNALKSARRWNTFGVYYTIFLALLVIASAIASGETPWFSWIGLVSISISTGYSGLILRRKIRNAEEALEQQERMEFLGVGSLPEGWVPI